MNLVFKKSKGDKKMNKIKKSTNKQVFALKKPIAANGKKQGLEFANSVSWKKSLVLGDDSLNDTYRLNSFMKKDEEIRLAKVKQVEFWNLNNVLRNLNGVVGQINLSRCLHDA